MDNEYAFENEDNAEKASDREEKRIIYAFFKRLTDIIVSGIAMVVLSPLFAVIALFVKSDGGPAIFSQDRAGKDGKYFKMYKFRSMVVDAEAKLEELRDQNEAEGFIFKMENDPRVTKVGRFLRRTSLDELPQLLNVFKGDMSLVGPRPPLRYEVEQYNSYQRRRLTVKPGLTCIWQCSGRSEVGLDEWMRMDMEYIEKRGYFYDWLIIFKTIPAVILGKGAK